MVTQRMPHPNPIDTFFKRMEMAGDTGPLAQLEGGYLGTSRWCRCWYR